MERKKQTLVDIGNRNPFKVPENYFSQLNETIMANLPEKEFSATKPVSLWEKAKPLLYLAAMFVGLFFMIQTLMTKTNSKEDYWSDVRISEEEFFEYVETQFIEEDYFDLVGNKNYLNSL